MSNDYDIFVVVQEDLTHEEALAGKAAEMKWFSVDHTHSRDEAIELVHSMSEQHEATTGFGFSQLED